jgi:hypothetical protein
VIRVTRAAFRAGRSRGHAFVHGGTKDGVASFFRGVDKSVGEGGLAIVLGERKCADDFAVGPGLSEGLSNNATLG